MYVSIVSALSTKINCPSIDIALPDCNGYWVPADSVHGLTHAPCERYEFLTIRAWGSLLIARAAVLIQSELCREFLLKRMVPLVLQLIVVALAAFLFAVRDLSLWNNIHDPSPFSTL